MRRIIFLHLLAILCLMQPGMSLRFFSSMHTASSYLTCCIKTYRLFSVKHFPPGQPPEWTDAWSFSSPRARLYSSACWASQVSFQPISSSCWGSSVWLPLYGSLYAPRYKPLLPVMLHQQTCWGLFCFIIHINKDVTQDWTQANH